MERKLLSIDEAAERLNVSSSTVRRFIRRGKLAVQKVGGQWRFDPMELQKAFEQGLLSGGGHESVGVPDVAGVVPEWARSPLAFWRQMLVKYLETESPDHVVANDRRGAKVWTLLTPKEYFWGKNLWHSTAIDMMSAEELRQSFAGKKVVLFDEMIQHGYEMNRLRNRLEAIGSRVTSFVCICRKSHLEAGELIEFKVVACEYLDDPDFRKRATMISQLMMLSQPPLDVDHLVVRGALRSNVTASQFVENLANWGLPFIVRAPDPDADQRFLAVTLDRPQFFDTMSATGKDGFRFCWDGPCKIRLYVNLSNRECFCSFVIYPQIEGDSRVWDQISANGQKSHAGNGQDALHEPAVETDITRVYENKCMDLALSMLRDFIISGAANACGIDLVWNEAVDPDHLRATFGPKRGKKLEQQVKNILGQSKFGQDLFWLERIVPPPFLARGEEAAFELSHDASSCRRELLSCVPHKHDASSDGMVRVAPIAYGDLFRRLINFAQTTVGRVLDYELDWGTVKPVIAWEQRLESGNQSTVVWRAFYRGEFDPWFEPGDEKLHGHDDAVMQKTLGIGPTVVEHFLKRTDKTDLTPTHFAKLFTNLRHDWRKQHGYLYYYLQPYRFGPIPFVEELPTSGKQLPFERFLLEQGCIVERTERHGSQTWRRYRPADDSRTPWRTLYERNTDGAVKAHIGSLVRFYAEVQNKCATTRPAEPGRPRLGIFHDPLVVLGAARNQKTAYLCGRFEFDDWRNKGECIFGRIRAIAEQERHHVEPFLRDDLRQFAEPATLLAEKVEMYRHLPYLRKQIEALRDTGDFEIAHFVLESIDVSPRIDTDPRYPIQNLYWAQKVMRAFSSLTRQILTQCGLDVDDRVDSDKIDASGRNRDAAWYTAELMQHAPELRGFEKELSGCVRMADSGVLTHKTAKCLSDVFRFIVGMFDRDDRLPRPTSVSAENRKLHRQQEFVSILLEIQLPSPYGITVADVRPFMEMLRFRMGRAYSEEAEVEAFHELRKEISDQVRELMRPYPAVHYCGISGDSIVLASKDTDGLLAATFALRQLRVKMVEEQFLVGCIIAGIALHKKDMGAVFRGVFPGVTALKIGDRQKRKLGTIAVSKAFHNLLSSAKKVMFFRADGENCDQGDVYLCETELHE